jgi:hypothetical protein
MKINLTIIAALIVAAALIYFLVPWESCNKPKTNEDQIKLVAENQILKDSLDSYKVFNDSLLHSIATKDSSIRYMATQLVDKTKQLNKSKVVIVDLREELRDWRDKDTAYTHPRFDSLLFEIDKMVVLLNGYQDLINQLSKEIQTQRDNYESLAAKRAQMIADLQRSYNNVYTISEKLFNDKYSLQQKLKTEKIKFGVAALLAIAEGILLSLK